MNKLLLLTIALVLAFIAFMPFATFAKTDNASKKSMQSKHVYSKTVSVEARNGGTKHVADSKNINLKIKDNLKQVNKNQKVASKKTFKVAKTQKGCVKECINGANKTIVKSSCATCGKSLGKKNNITEVKNHRHVTGGQSTHKTCGNKCGNSSQHQTYGYGYGHCKNDHNYNGYGYGHCKHKYTSCTSCYKKKAMGGGKNYDHKDSIVKVFVPTAYAESAEASSDEQPEALPEAGVGILFQFFVFLSTLFGVWSIRQFI